MFDPKTLAPLPMSESRAVANYDKALRVAQAAFNAAHDAATEAFDAALDALDALAAAEE
jgi:hypothetical protein